MARNIVDQIKGFNQPLTVIHGGIFRPDEVFTDPYYGYPIGIRMEKDGSGTIGVEPEQRHLALLELRRRFPDADPNKVVFSEIAECQR